MLKLVHISWIVVFVWSMCLWHLWKDIRREKMSSLKSANLNPSQTDECVNTERVQITKLTAAHFDLQTLIQRARWVSSNWKRSQLRRLKSWLLLTLFENNRWVSNWKREGSWDEMKTSFARTGWIFTQPFCRARSLGHRSLQLQVFSNIFSEANKNTVLEGAAKRHVYGVTRSPS